MTLLALLLFLAIVAPSAGVATAQAFVQWILVVAVFGCILLHELVHALVARRFGCETREIVLLPIGGIAHLERIPEQPAHELLVALAGPLMNFVIAAVLAALISLLGLPFWAEQKNLAGAFLVPLFWSNLALGGFNLLPAFPLDGGRVLRAALASRMGRARATAIAAVVGRVMAAVFVVAGLVIGATMLAIIGLFVWFTSGQESALVSMTTRLAHATVADAMIRAVHVIDAETPVRTAAEQMLADGHRELMVTDHGRITGAVTADDLASRMELAVSDATVRSAQRDVPIVSPTLALDDVVEPLEESGIVLVGDSDVIIGMLTAEQLAMYASLH